VLLISSFFIVDIFLNARNIPNCPSWNWRDENVTCSVSPTDKLDKKHTKKEERREAANV
jgi:hypothetical protein